VTAKTQNVAKKRHASVVKKVAVVAKIKGDVYDFNFLNHPLLISKKLYTILPTKSAT